MIASGRRRGGSPAGDRARGRAPGRADPLGRGLLGALGLAGCGLLLAALLGGCASMRFHRGAMPGEPRGARFAQVGGARVRYLDVGEGPAVVLVHGFASSLETWDGVVPALRRAHRVVALDLKGFGWTDRPPGDYSPEAQARLVLGLLDRLGVERAAFVGHSWGASVVLAAALLAPERVTRVALYDAWVYEAQLPSFFLWARARGLGEALFWLFYDEQPDVKMAHAFYDRRLMTEALVEDVERALRRPGTKAAALAAVRGQRLARLERRYRTIRKPVLLLWGREDEVTTLDAGERLARELPGAHLVVYPRCGHFPMLEAAATSGADLQAFLAAGPAPDAEDGPAAPGVPVAPAAPAARPAGPSATGAEGDGAAGDGAAGDGAVGDGAAGDGAPALPWVTP